MAPVWGGQAGRLEHSAGVAWEGSRASLWARIRGGGGGGGGVIPLLRPPSSPAGSIGGGASGPHLRQTHTARAVECPRWMKKEVHTFIGVVGVRLRTSINQTTSFMH